MNERILTTVYRVARRQFALADDFELRPEHGMADVPGWDSLNSVNLILSVQEEFGVDIPLEAMARIETLGGLAEAVGAQLRYAGREDEAAPDLHIPEGGFLRVPRRPAKPRSIGLTCVIDNGLGPAALEDALAASAGLVDYVKFGWGTGHVVQCLDRKIELLRRTDVPFWFGGTLFEVARQQNRIPAMIAWLRAHACNVVEISSGTVEMDTTEIEAHTRTFRDAGFTVLVEVGSKSRDHALRHADWVARIKAALIGGASYVLCEGRETGTAGVYHDDGKPRVDLIEEICSQGIDLRRLIWEAPRRDQQVWFIEQFGVNCNFANIQPGDVVSLETLRQGLRADTLFLVHNGGPA
jgi:phosphosulfolactate synthase